MTAIATLAPAGAFAELAMAALRHAVPLGPDGAQRDREEVALALDAHASLLAPRHADLASALLGAVHRLRQGTTRPLGTAWGTLTSRVDEHRGPARNVRWSKAGLLSGLAAGLAVGLGAALLAGPAKAIVAGVVTASVIALAAGLTSGAADPTAAASVRTVLRRDAHAFAAYSAAAAVAGALVGGLTNGLDSIRVDNLATTMADLVANGFAVGLAAAIVASAMFGLLHAAWWPYTLTRAWLAAQGRLPWRLMGFLDEAHRRGALRQVGSYYQFRHIELQRELARDPQPRSG